MQIDRPGYSGRIYRSEGLRRHAEFALKTLDSIRDEFDFVAVTGKSGMAVAFAALAMGADFDLVTIRKGESSHGHHIEGFADGYRYVVIDDLIDSGATLDRIRQELADFADARGVDHPEMVAAILYQGSDKGGSWKVRGQAKPVRVYGV